MPGEGDAGSRRRHKGLIENGSDSPALLAAGMFKSACDVSIQKRERSACRRGGAGRARYHLRDRRLVIVGCGAIPMMDDRDWWQLGGTHYRELAGRLREVAGKCRLPNMQRELLDLAALL
jgi:hypothetical protein